MMEANTSLFWGLSLMLYQATLVADQTPLDSYLAARTAGDPNAAALLDDIALQISAEHGVPITSADIVEGLKLFELPAPTGLGCMFCHIGAETTAASARNIQHGVEADDMAFANAGFDQRMERMFWRIPALTAGTDRITLDPLNWTVTESNTRTPDVPPADVPLAVYDSGYYNIGVRPTAEDLGIDNMDPFGKPWSIVRYLQNTVPDPSYIKVPGGTVNCGAAIVRNSSGYPLLAGSLRKNERVAVAGSFKVPALRNVELTGPYFHNGNKSTLRQVMELYDDGGDFDNPTLAPLIQQMNMSDTQMRNAIAFMLALTDERVRWQRAPFDHPQLFVPNGDVTPGVDNPIEIPAVGAAGGSSPLQRFLNLNPFTD
jgi:hypothetical protein